MEKSINPHFNSFTTMDITGETYATNGCYSNYYIKPYSFYCEIRGERPCYHWYIYLSLTGEGSRDIELMSGQCPSLRGAKDNFKEFLEEEKHDYTTLIEDWKVSHGSPAFDKDLNYVGTFYASRQTVKHNKDRWDYYNEDPVTKPFKYILEYSYYSGLVYFDYTWTTYGYTCTSGKDKEIINKMLENIERTRFERFWKQPVEML